MNKKKKQQKINKKSYLAIECLDKCLDVINMYNDRATEQVLECEYSGKHLKEKIQQHKDVVAIFNALKPLYFKK